jgi:molybdopterin-guanine dinucleotide biosynthesis protein B
VAVACDGPRPDGTDPSLVWLDLNAPAAVLAWLEQSILKKSPQVPAPDAVNQG